MTSYYGVDQMRTDLAAHRDCLYQVARKVPADVDKCTFSGIGSARQLVSTPEDGDRIIPGKPALQRRPKAPNKNLEVTHLFPQISSLQLNFTE